MRNMPSNWHIDRLANLLIIKDMNDNKLMNRAADNIRILAASMVEKANSGHPGGAMGGADFVNVLFSEFLVYDPENPRWEGRDRFFLDPGPFGVFQAVMPMTGWICVHTIVELFSSFETFIPWIALALLGYIGGKMLVDGIKGEEAEEATELSAGALFMQGVATSIDALSVGFTISEYGWLMALAASIIIAVVTFFLCMAGLNIGKCKAAGEVSLRCGK